MEKFVSGLYSDFVSFMCITFSSVFLAQKFKLCCTLTLFSSPPSLICHFLLLHLSSVIFLAYSTVLGFVTVNLALSYMIFFFFFFFAFLFYAFSQNIKKKKIIYVMVTVW